MSHDAVDQTEAVGFVRINHVREQRELLRLVDAHEARQQPRAAEVDRQPALGEDLGEPSAVAGIDQVASERQVHPRTDRVTVDLGDHRLLQLCERQHRLADVAHVVQHVETLDAVGRAREVGSGAERVARARDDDHPILRALGDRSENFAKFAEHHRVDRILAPRVVEGDRDDAAVVALD